MNEYSEIQYSNNNSYIGEFKDNIMDGEIFYGMMENTILVNIKKKLKYGFGIYISEFKIYDCYIGFFEHGKTFWFMY